VRITTEISEAAIEIEMDAAAVMILTRWWHSRTPEKDRRRNMTRSKMFRLGLPLTLALAVASVAAEAQPAADAQLQQRVQTALHSDPYFYDAHVDVMIENGNVVLRGIVFDDVDLRAAIRIASQAAGDRRVIDDLSIVDTRRR
jgi:hypothetical protein